MQAIDRRFSLTISSVVRETSCFLTFVSTNILSKQEVREWGEVFCTLGVIGLDYFHIECNFVFDVRVGKDEFCANCIRREAVVACKHLCGSNYFKSKRSIRLLELLSKVTSVLC